ncbi:hypothetical protein ACWGJV_03125 [Streptomyces tendae]
MSAEHVVGIVGIVVIAACLVVIEEMLRRDIKKHGKRVLPAPTPRCSSCGHDNAYHWKGSCRYERGDVRDGNDSYGTTWKGYTTRELCGCTKTPSQL